MTWPETVTLLGLGFATGFSPTLYAVLLRALEHRRGTLAAAVPLAAGLFASAVVLVLVFHAVDPETLIRALRGRVEALLVQRVVDLVAAALLVGCGVVFWRLRRRPRTRRAGRASRDGSTSTRDLVAAGLLDNLVSASSIATIYVAGRVISGTTTAPALRVAAFLVFALALVGPFFLLAVAYARVPAFARGLRDVTGWLGRQDPRPLVAVALVAAGLAFAALGVWGQPLRL